MWRIMPRWTGTESCNVLHGWVISQYEAAICTPRSCSRTFCACLPRAVLVLRLPDYLPRPRVRRPNFAYTLPPMHSPCPLHPPVPLPLRSPSWMMALPALPWTDRLQDLFGSWPPLPFSLPLRGSRHRRTGPLPRPLIRPTFHRDTRHLVPCRGHARAEGRGGSGWGVASQRSHDGSRVREKV